MCPVSFFSIGKLDDLDHSYLAYAAAFPHMNSRYQPPETPKGSQKPGETSGQSDFLETPKEEGLKDKITGSCDSSEKNVQWSFSGNDSAEDASSNHPDTRGLKSDSSGFKGAERDRTAYNRCCYPILS